MMHRLMTWESAVPGERGIVFLLLIVPANLGPATVIYFSSTGVSRRPQQLRRG